MSLHKINYKKCYLIVTNLMYSSRTSFSCVSFLLACIRDLVTN